MSHEMPLYLQHKIVRAALIEAAADDEQDTITLQLSTGALVQESHRWFFDVIVKLENKPLVGCYYIRDSDGYTSVSPAAAFESGCSLVSEMLDHEMVLNLNYKGEYALIMPGDLKTLEHPE